MWPKFSLTSCQIRVDLSILFHVKYNPEVFKSKQQIRGCIFLNQVIKFQNFGFISILIEIVHIHPHVLALIPKHVQENNVPKIQMSPFFLGYFNNYHKALLIFARRQNPIRRLLYYCKSLFGSGPHERFAKKWSPHPLQVKSYIICLVESFRNTLNTQIPNLIIL